MEKVDAMSDTEVDAGFARASACVAAPNGASADLIPFCDVYSKIVRERGDGNIVVSKWSLSAASLRMS